VERSDCKSITREGDREGTVIDLAGDLVGVCVCVCV